MIAFDLDGVFVPDIDLNGGDWNNTMHLFRSNHLKPIFKPSFDFVIISGRPPVDHPLTAEWVNKYFYVNPPYEVVLNTGDIQDAAAFKAQELDKMDYITAFVESDPEQAKYIEFEVGHKIDVFTFDTFINRVMSILL